MDENFIDVVLLGHFKKGEEVMDVRVHAPIAEQTKEMKLARAGALHGLLEERNALQPLAGNQKIDAGDVHVHDAARAHVHVADFAVAHLAFGQTDERAGGLNQRVGKFFQQFIVGGFARQGDGVALRFRTVAPAIQHGQYDWFWSFTHDPPKENYIAANSRSTASRRSTSSAVL